MRIAASMILAITLAAPGCDGCPSSTNPFTVDEALTASDVQALMEEGGIADIESLTCEVACGWYGATMSGSPDSIDAGCVLNVEDPSGSDTAEIVGHLTCSGVRTISSCA